MDQVAMQTSVTLRSAAASEFTRDYFRILVRHSAERENRAGRGQHGQAALSGSKTKAPGFAGGYLLRFRHVISGSLALASLNHTCRNLVPTFPQRSPPSFLTTSACGGLRSTPDCRPRRTSLHLSYSCAAPCGPAILVTQDPKRTKASFCLPTLFGGPRRVSTLDCSWLAGCAGCKEGDH